MYISLTSYCSICVLTVLALALLIHVWQVSAFIYEVFDFISITACGYSCLIQDISKNLCVYALSYYRPACCLDPHLLICVQLLIVLLFKLLEKAAHSRIILTASQSCLLPLCWSDFHR